jgi:hypothetical protein
VLFTELRVPLLSRRNQQQPSPHYQCPQLSIPGKGIGLFRSILCLLVLAVVLPLLIPAAARADRGPTKGERAAIEKVVRRHNAGPYIRVIVSDVRISTADPHWARAVYSVRFQKSGVRQDVESIYRRANGRGWNASYNQVPAPVEADLGWGDSDRMEKVVRIATYVVMGIAALAILLVLGSLGGDQPSPGARSARPPTSVYEPGPQPAREKPCPNCGGNGRFQCSICHAQNSACGYCSGRGWRQCENCHGTGQVPA